jgi:hypothetical protein
MKRNIFILCLLMVLCCFFFVNKSHALFGIGEGDKPGDPILLDTQFDPATVYEKSVTLSKGEELKGITSMVVPSFQVEVIMQNDASEQYGFLLYETSLSVSYRSKGVEDKDIQGFVEKLYDDFVTTMKDMGVAVVPLETLKGTEAFKKLAEKGEASPVEKSVKQGRSKFFAPAGLPVYFLPGEKRLSAFGQLSAGFSNTFQIENDLVKELKAPVMNVRLVCNFVDFKTLKDKGWAAQWRPFQTAESAVERKLGLSVMPMESRFSIITPKMAEGMFSSQDRCVVAMKSAVISPENIASEVKEVTSAAKSAGNVALSVLSFASALTFGGKKQVFTTQDMEVSLIKDGYQKAMSDTIKTSFKAMGLKLRDAVKPSDAAVKPADAAPPQSENSQNAQPGKTAD